MRAPFSVKTKTFETPFGPLACDREWVKGLAERSRFDVFGDEYQHKAEHAIEFQAVFLSCGTSWDQSAPRALASYPSLGQSSARLHHDAQHVDPDEGSIVSHASVSFIR